MKKQQILYHIRHRQQYHPQDLLVVIQSHHYQVHMKHVDVLLDIYHNGQEDHNNNVDNKIDSNNKDKSIVQIKEDDIEEQVLVGQVK